MKKAFAITIVFLALKTAFAQSVFEVNHKLGRGVNMGNMFEAPSEEAWGNPFRDDYFQRIADLGFKHVRIPITWDIPDRAQQEAPYKINAVFMDRIKYVVKKAQDTGLMAIINMHHHEKVFENPAAAKQRFLSQWQQISEAFKDANENILFEVLNEPHGELSPALWNNYFAEALSIIRKTNPTRPVLMGVAQYGGLSAVPQLIFPKDDHIILTIHYYDPFQFTHQGAEWVNGSEPWLGTKWDNTDRDQNAIKSQFQFAIDLAKQKNIPINIGEFGAYSKADNASRILWTSFMARWMEEQGFSWAYWEFSAGFGFFNPSTNQYKQDLVDALLKNPLPPPVETKAETIYQSDFNSDNNGWNLGVTSPAIATLARENNAAKISITASSTSSWHVQFVRNNFTLKTGKKYLITFDGYADKDMGLTFYLGQSVNPYNSYSGYTGISLSTSKKSFEHAFTMSAPDDDKARFVFDMATSTGTVYLSNLKVSELLEGIEEVIEEKPLSIESNGYKVNIYPNPTREFVSIEGAEKFHTLDILDIRGKVISHFDLLKNKNEQIPIKNLNAGVYLFHFRSAVESVVKKVVIE
ncbi:Por secretion system C-terminal sorting domain-containing protein [Spirosomataceae bacterium TFI 002]|nr:Por secretion system C-terminal sorting domain-containing protein [Spirosomataceae bacterium TFI 002]